MAVFAIQRSNNGLSAFVDGADVGREVDAAKFNTPASFGKEATGLAKTFGEAVNDAQSNVAAEIAVAPVEQKMVIGKPQDFSA